jgi:hypothetical protein
MWGGHWRICGCLRSEENWRWGRAVVLGGREGWEGGRDSNVLTVVGHPGRLGNWLFRAASGLGLAWDTGNTFLGVFLI